MKLHIEIIGDDEDECVVVKCKKITQEVQELQSFLANQQANQLQLTFYKEEEEYYLHLEEVLFFETQQEVVYAHTINEAYRMKLRLYELEELLPSHFVRISKSTIANVKDIYSIERGLASSSRIQFRNTHKDVYVSRMYYKQLKAKLQERR